MYLIYWFIQPLFGWKKTPRDGLVIRLPSVYESNIPIENFFPTENIIAYTLRDDSSIYIANGREEVVAAHLNADIDGDIWRFQENGKVVKRDKQVVEISIHDYINLTWTPIIRFNLKLMFLMF